MKIFLFFAHSNESDTPEQATLRGGVIECGGSISHVRSGVNWHIKGQGYEAYGVFDRDEDAIAFKLKYL